MSNSYKTALAALIALPCLCIACSGVPLAGDLLAGLFTNQVTVVIQNDTVFVASPDIRTSDSRNGLEDLFDEQRILTDFGNGGTVGPNETVRFALPCDDDLESIYFGGASFRDINNLPFGDVDRNRNLRRDHDFDCGDVITIQLTGGIFDFSASVTIEQTAAGGSPWGRPGDDEDDPRTPEPDEDDDIADFLDDLFD